MGADSDFVSKARHAVNLADRLNRLHAEGKIDRDKFQKHMAAVNATLPAVKAAHMMSIGESLVENARAESKTESDRSVGAITAKEVESIKSSMSMRRSELESERDMVELSDGSQYIDYLRNQLETKKYEHYWEPKYTAKKVLDGAAGAPLDVAPLWATLTALAIIAVPFILGLVFGRWFIGFAASAAIMAALAAETLVLHLSTSLADIDTSSIPRAFKTLMMNTILTGLVAAGFMAAMLFTAPSALSAKDGLVSVAQSLATMIILLVSFGLLAGVVMPAVTINMVYECGVWRALATVGINYFIWVAIRILIGAAILMMR